jgi:trichothecene 3-O-acetyltransferase
MYCIPTGTFAQSSRLFHVHFSKGMTVVLLFGRTYTLASQLQFKYHPLYAQATVTQSAYFIGNSNPALTTMVSNESHAFGQPQHGEKKTAVENAGKGELEPDAMSQFPFLDGHTQISFGFRQTPGTSREAVVAALQDGLDKVTAKIPWLGWQVVRSSADGLLKRAPWPADGIVNGLVRVKHCDDLMPPMRELLRAGVPIGTLDGAILAPWPALPAPHGLTGPVPVFALTANFLRGDGLVIVLSCHHTVMDGPAIFQLTYLLATVMSGGEVSEADAEQANRDRAEVIPLIPLGEPMKDFSHLRQPPGYIPIMPSGSFAWCYFMLPGASVLALMKQAASSSTALAATSSQGSQFSENDLISAFCWQRITAVRLAAGSFKPETSTKFKRTVDARSSLGVPRSYMGQMVHHAAARLPMSQVATQPLVSLARVLRQQLKACTTPWAVRSCATFVAREPDKSQLLYGGSHDPNTDLGSVSATVSAGDFRESKWAIPAFWGPLLKYSFNRRLNMAPVPGLVVIQPAENGAIPLCLCLPPKQLDDLRKDLVWKHYTKYVG